MPKLLSLACLSTLGHVAVALLVNSSSKSVRVNLLAHSSVRQAVNGACGSSPSFSRFVSMYGRAYSDEEYATRRSLFESRVADIEAHNCRTIDRLWHATVNPLTDRTDNELASMRGRSRARYADADVPVQSSLLQTPKKRAPMPADNLAEKTVSYTHLKAMKTIRNQGDCGSCWAHGTAAMLWAHREIYHGDDSPVNVEQLVSCVPNPEACGGLGGCKGATAELAMDYVMHNGMASEKTWKHGVDCPWWYQAQNKRPIPQPTSEEGMASLLPWKDPKADPKWPKEVPVPSVDGLVGWTKLPENKQEPLMRAVYERGPVAVSVTAGPDWNKYGGGIFNSCEKDSIINHIVVLVGFGNEDGHKHYWTIQNSWSSDWGEKGFMRILRQDNETAHCGWDNKPQDGTGCQGGPSEVKICGMCGILYDSVVPHFEGKTKAALMMLEWRKA